MFISVKEKKKERKKNRETEKNSEFSLEILEWIKCRWEKRNDLFQVSMRLELELEKNFILQRS